MAALQGAYPTTRGDYQLADVMAPAAITTYSPLAEGDAGTFQSLDAMRDAVLGRIPPDYSGYQDPLNIRAAQSICANAAGHDERAQIAALFNWVIANITYTPHPFNQQVVQDAQRTMQLRSGDCVSLSVLLATLLAALGYQSQFVAQWLNGEEASHVYVEALLNDGSELALDAVASDEPMGWRQPKGDKGFEFAQEIFNG